MYGNSCSSSLTSEVPAATTCSVFKDLRHLGKLKCNHADYTYLFFYGKNHLLISKNLKTEFL